MHRPGDVEERPAPYLPLPRGTGTGCHVGRALYNLERSALKKLQNLAVDEMLTFSPGIWTSRMSGPIEIMSIPPSLLPMMPHSRPAWTVSTMASFPENSLQ